MPSASMRLRLFATERRKKPRLITLLFVAVPNKNSIKIKQNNKEIESANFQASLPKKASPSAKYFWSAKRGPVKKIRKFGLQLISSRRRVNKTDLYHVNACLQQTCCESAARTEMRFPAVYEQADRTRRRRWRLEARALRLWLAPVVHRPERRLEY